MLWIRMKRYWIPCWGLKIGYGLQICFTSLTKWFVVRPKWNDLLTLMRVKALWDVSLNYIAHLRMFMVRLLWNECIIPMEIKLLGTKSVTIGIQSLFEMMSYGMIENAGIEWTRCFEQFTFEGSKSHGILQAFGTNGNSTWLWWNGIVWYDMCEMNCVSVFRLFHSRPRRTVCVYAFRRTRLYGGHCAKDETCLVLYSCIVVEWLSNELSLLLIRLLFGLLVPNEKGLESWWLSSMGNMTIIMYMYWLHHWKGNCVLR